jgi:hypothetical protein
MRNKADLSRDQVSGVRDQRPDTRCRMRVPCTFVQNKANFGESRQVPAVSYAKQTQFPSAQAGPGREVEPVGAIVRNKANLLGGEETGGASPTLHAVPSFEGSRRGLFVRNKPNFV